MQSRQEGDDDRDDSRDEERHGEEGTNGYRQVADAEDEEHHRERPMYIDGDFESQWLIIDYGNVMVHVLTPEKRDYYALEELWGDAPEISLKPELETAVSDDSPKPVRPARKKPAAKKAATKKAPARTTKKS